MSGEQNGNAGAPPAGTPPAGTPPADGGTPPAGTPPAGTPPAPEYKFTAPDGVKFDDGFVTEFTGIAKEAKLGQEHADKVVGLAAKMSQKWNSDLEARVANQHAQWKTAAKADQEIGGDNLDANLGIALKGVKAYAPGLEKLLQESGLGQHPEVIRHFYRLGKTVKEDTTVHGSQGGTPRVSTFSYPNSKHN